MTPEMLEKLAIARQKAHEVRKQIKLDKESKAIEELPERLEQQAKIKEELNKPKPPKPEVKSKKVVEPEPSDDEEEALPPKVVKKKKKQVVVMEDSSSDEEQIIYVPKRKTKKPVETPVETPVEKPVEKPVYKPPPRPPPPPPPPPRQPTYGELARMGLGQFRGF